MNSVSLGAVRLQDVVLTIYLRSVSESRRESDPRWRAKSHLVGTKSAVSTVVRSVSSALLGPVREATLIHYLYVLPYIGAIANVNSVHDEFTRSCAQAGPKYCAIATKNSTQADIAAWLQSLMDLAFDHPLEEITSAFVRGMWT